jgi:uncharacterized protein YndB with AHSA1/START domain
MEPRTGRPVVRSAEVTVDGNPDRVFDRLIDLGEWWPEDIEGSASGPGRAFGLTAGDGHRSMNKVLHFERGRRFAWTIVGGEWPGAVITFALAPQRSSTHITFTYEGKVPEQEADRLIQLWDRAIKDRLYDYLTYGRTKWDFTVNLEVDLPPSAVFEALTRDVRKWWGGTDLRGSTTRLNDEFVIEHAGAHCSRQRIIELVPGERLQWLVTESELSWLKGNRQEWTGTKLLFRLAEVAGRTRLRFSHIGLTSDKECYEACSREGWQVVIGNYLYTYLTTGKAHF